MTEQPGDSPVPEWTRGDRLRKALREADIGVAEMADYLGVSRNTASNWIADRIDPSIAYVRLWAMRTGVPYNWLCHGDMAACTRLHKRGSDKRNCLTVMAA